MLRPVSLNFIRRMKFRDTGRNVTSLQSKFRI